MILKYLFPLYCLSTYLQRSRLSLVIPCPDLDVGSGTFGSEKPSVTWKDERRQLRKKVPVVSPRRDTDLGRRGVCRHSARVSSGLSPCTASAGPLGPLGIRADTL